MGFVAPGYRSEGAAVQESTTPISRLVTSGMDSRLLLWDVSSRLVLRSATLPAPARMAVATDGATLALVWQAERTGVGGALYDARTLRRRALLEDPLVSGSASPVPREEGTPSATAKPAGDKNAIVRATGSGNRGSVLWLPGGRFVVRNYEQNAILVHDAATGRIVARHLLPATEEIISLAAEAETGAGMPYRVVMISVPRDRYSGAPPYRYTSVITVLGVSREGTFTSPAIARLEIANTLAGSPHLAGPDRLLVTEQSSAEVGGIGVPESRRLAAWSLRTRQRIATRSLVDLDWLPLPQSVLLFNGVSAGEFLNFDLQPLPSAASGQGIRPGVGFGVRLAEPGGSRAALSPDGGTLCIQGYDEVEMLRLPDMTSVATLPAYRSSRIRAWPTGLTYHKESTSLSLVYANGATSRWSLREARLVGYSDGEPKYNELKGASLSPDGGRLAVSRSGARGGDVEIWSMAARGQAFLNDRLDGPFSGGGSPTLRLSGHSADALPTELGFTPDGRYLISAYHGGQRGREHVGYVWDTTSGARIAPWHPEETGRMLPLKSPDKEAVEWAEINGSEIRRRRLDRRTGKIEFADILIAPPAKAPSVYADGRVPVGAAALGGSFQPGEWVWEDAGDRGGCCLSPDGTRMALGGRGMLAVIEIAARRVSWMRRLPVSAGVNAGQVEAANDLKRTVQAINNRFIAELERAKGITDAAKRREVEDAARRTAEADIRAALSAPRTSSGELPDVAEVTSLAFSPDGHYLAYATDDRDGSLRVCDAVSGQEVAVLGQDGTGHAGEVRALCWLTSQHLASAGDDQQVVLWTVAPSSAPVEGGQRAVSLLLDSGVGFAPSPRETRRVRSLIVLADGTYMGHRSGADLAAFRLTDSDGLERVFPFDQFDLLFNRPDRVREALQTLSGNGIDRKEIAGYRQAWERRVTTAGLAPEAVEADAQRWRTTPAVMARRLPTVTLATDHSGDSALSVRIFPAAEDRSGVEARGGTLHVWVNNVPLFGTRGRALSDPAPAENRDNAALQVDLSVPLLPGANRVEVAVRTATGAESLRAVRTLEGKRTSAPSRLLIFAVGVDNYRNTSVRSLRYAAADALALCARWSVPGDAGALSPMALQRMRNEPERFPSCRWYLDQEATRDHILTWRKQLMATEPEDRVVLFFSGHGIRDTAGRFFLATHDIDPARPEGTGLALEEFTALLDGIPARRRLILLDACYSGPSPTDGNVPPKPGAAAPAPGVVPSSDQDGDRSKSGTVALAERASPAEEYLFSLEQNLFADLRRGVGANVFAAATGYAVAVEKSTLEHGAFTFALLSALAPEGPQATQRRVDTASDLAPYLETEVRKLTGDRQVPTVRATNPLQSFPLR